MIGFTGICAPTLEQSRFMFHVCSHRPHLDMIHGSWRCVGQCTYGYGKTRNMAYRNWFALLPHNR